jgi:ribosomal protein S2
MGYWDANYAVKATDVLALFRTILDTNSNPNIADLFIPASDDSSSGIPLILDELAEAVLAGQNS